MKKKKDFGGKKKYTENVGRLELRLRAVQGCASYTVTAGGAHVSGRLESSTGSRVVIAA